MGGRGQLGKEVWLWGSLVYVLPVDGEDWQTRTYSKQLGGGGGGLPWVGLSEVAVVPEPLVN